MPWQLYKAENVFDWSDCFTGRTNFMLKRTVMVTASSFSGKLAFFLLMIGLLCSCKKNQVQSPPLSTEKKITFFAIETYSNIDLSQDAVGVITNDTIRFTLAGGYPLFYLFPTIHFSGKRIAPAETIAQNFSNPVTYTITAEDGTTKKFIVLGRSILNTSSKDMLSFSFRASNNPSISADAKGDITNDSVLVKLPFGTNLNNLAPFILINGSSLSPDNLTPQDFTHPVIYKVGAEDGSSKNYIVVVRQ